ncbi:Neurotransmitter-gated ion-channel ligand binding domain protein, partial [Teladorsagia circumcincta]
MRLIDGPRVEAKYPYAPTNASSYVVSRFQMRFDCVAHPNDINQLSHRHISEEYFSEYDEDEERLVIDLFREYNSLIRPVQNAPIELKKTQSYSAFYFSPPVTVDFGVAMILLINVDEKNQILQTNVWLTMKWNDFQLRWHPEDYGNITNLHVPPDRVWLPDIVLFNNADGNYEVSFRSNAFVESNGDVT